MERPVGSRRNDVVHYFKDASGDWRWHRKADNSEIVSESGEGYKNLQDCLDMATALNPDVVIKPHEEEHQQV